MDGLVYDTMASRRPTNLTVNSDLMKRAKERRINVSALLEKALAEELRRREQAEWTEANADAIEHYNDVVRKVGLFSDGLRTF